MKEKTRWGGSYFGISEIHPHQKFITLGKIFLFLYFPTALSTRWTCKHQPGALTRRSKVHELAQEHVVPAQCDCPGQPQWLKNIRALL